MTMHTEFKKFPGEYILVTQWKPHSVESVRLTNEHIEELVRLKETDNKVEVGEKL